MIPHAVLGWTLIHFVWQGALVALVLWTLLPAFRSPRVRYALALGFLAVAAAAPLITYSRGVAPIGGLSVAPPGPVGTGIFSTIIHTPAESVDWVAWVPVAWAAGVLVFSLRLLAGWWAVRRLTRHGCHQIENRWTDVAARMGVLVRIRFLESLNVTVPSVIGAFRPVVLLPASLLNRLPVEQIEVLIAHELAHIRRHDYLINWVQTVVETVLFYHPAIWWISRVVRREREACCDDLAVEACSFDCTSLAHALLRLEELRSAAELALAASGGDLAARIRRLLDHGPLRSPAPFLTLGALVAGALIVLLPDRAESQAKPDSAPPAGIESRAADARDVELAKLRMELERTKAELERLRSEAARSLQTLSPSPEKLRETEVLRAMEQVQAVHKIEQQRVFEDFHRTVEQMRAEANKLHADRRAAMEAAEAASAQAQELAKVRQQLALLAKESARAAQRDRTLGPYRKWIEEDVAYIATPEERREFQTLQSPAQFERFIEDFWKRRAPDRQTAENNKEEHYRRIASANERFGRRGVPGWTTPRGKMLIVRGSPQEIKSWPDKEEIWTYRGPDGEESYRFDLQTNSEGVRVIRPVR
jgi:GWxTD domain-containing protein